VEGHHLVARGGGDHRGAVAVVHEAQAQLAAHHRAAEERRVAQLGGDLVGGAPLAELDGEPLEERGAGGAAVERQRAHQPAGAGGQPGQPVDERVGLARRALEQRRQPPRVAARGGQEALDDVR
jgi:hypothetical protein